MKERYQAELVNLRNQEDIKHNYRRRVRDRNRYKHCQDTLMVVPKKQDPDPIKPQYVPVVHPEVVLTVQIFRPREEQQLDLRNVRPIDHRSFRIEQQLQVLGCQYLTELRDAICCVSDTAIVGEFSDDPHSTSHKTCQEVYKSGLFYISGTFYNDMRDPMNKDYSRVIIQWSEEEACDVGPFTSARMEDTKFVDLEIQLGLPYVYMHQGHCEHMLVFSDLRLMTSKDPQNLLDYPLIQVVQAKKPVNCMVCLLYPARWITVEDSRVPELPYFFCDKCFKAFNYDVHGNKIAEFKAYKYCDRTAIF